MTTNYTSTVAPFEVSTPFGVCTVKDTRVPYEGEQFARVTFKQGALTVNAKTYTGDVSFTLKPVTGPHNRVNDVYDVVWGDYYNSELTQKAYTKLREYLGGPEVMGALQRIGILAPPDPTEVRDYKRERVYSNAVSELHNLLNRNIDYNLPPEEREAIATLREELLDEVLVRIVSRRLDGVSWRTIQNGDYADAE